MIEFAETLELNRQEMEYACDFEGSTEIEQEYNSFWRFEIVTKAEKFEKYSGQASVKESRNILGLFIGTRAPDILFCSLQTVVLLSL